MINFRHIHHQILLFVVFTFTLGACFNLDLDYKGDDENGSIPSTEFNADRTEIVPLTMVKFTDLSINNPTTWWWEFGDGETSLLQNPEHTYTSLGSFDVSLTTTNSIGSHTNTKKNYINVSVTIGPTGTVTDAEGNSYKTIKIGPQWWMAENLKVSRYENGAAIKYISTGDDWLALDLDDKAYAAYDYNLAGIQSKGALYSWSAATNGQFSTIDNPVRVQGVCPSGWHLPGDEEWAQLEINLGMKYTVTDDYGHRGTNEGSKMASGANLWKSGALRNDSEFGYSGLDIKPFGYQSGSGTSLFLGEETFFWTATTLGNEIGDKAWDRRFLYDFAGVRRDFAPYDCGMYVRCVKD